MSPLVTAVMVTGKPGRKRLALAAIKAFEEQTHRHKELIIVTDGEVPDVKLTGKIRLIETEPGKTLGDLRNLGLHHAQGDWVAQWDDDDWYHPERIEQQLLPAVERQKASLLLYQVRYSLEDLKAILWCWTYPECPGIPGTMLFPMKVGIKFRSEPKHEDTHFLEDHFKDNIVVFDNVHFQHLYIRFYHGNNTWSKSHIMGQGVAPPCAEAITYVTEVVKKHYLR